MTEFDAAALVDKGFTLLTGENGPGWVNAVDPDMVDVRSIFMCPVAQVYGSYDSGLEILAGYADAFPGHDFASANGFDAPQVREDQYDALDAEWKRRITATR